jgi:hypothetical protein
VTSPVTQPAAPHNARHNAQRHVWHNTRGDLDLDLDLDQENKPEATRLGRGRRQAIVMSTTGCDLAPASDAGPAGRASASRWGGSMIESEFGTFNRAFRKVVTIFRLKFKVGEVEELSRSYFRLLGHAPLGDVLAAGKTWTTTHSTFPKPAEWLQALPAAPIVPGAADLRVMATPEREAYVRAEALCYQDEPCTCWDCQDAGVTDRALRFVPDDVNGVLDRAIDMVRNRVVVTGHWAHGAELARWYAARDAFFASAPRRGHMARVLAFIGGEREPGEEG